MNAPNTPAYSKLVDNDTLTEVHAIPSTKNILPHQDTWQTHNRETASLADTHLLAVNSAISQDAGAYVNQHDLSQHDNYLDYAATRDKGFSAGPNTDVTWNKTHEGNHHTVHEGTLTQTRQVQNDTSAIQAPDIHYQYGQRDTTMSGNTFSHSSVNSTITTGDEQSFINKALESAPLHQETLGQSNERYGTQNFNYNTMTTIASQFTHSGPLVIRAKKFDLANLTASTINLNPKNLGPATNSGTSIQIVLGDQTNIQSPTTTPKLHDYLQGISANFVVTKQDGSELAFGGGAASLSGSVYAITQALPNSMNQSNAFDIKEVQVTLVHNGGNGTDTTLAVNIIAQNTQAIFPTNTLSIPKSTWEQNKHVDPQGNVTYILNVNVLAPALLFNFRHDSWENQLTGDDKANYPVLKPYFAKEATYPGIIRTAPLSPQELDFFAAMGKNVTLFIHGYNVGFGTWPVGLSPTATTIGDQNTFTLTPTNASVSLCRDDDYFKAAYPQVPSSALNLLSIDQRYGSDAHKWLLCMEHSLNKAAGFDGQDYSKYTRLVGISWQGNPASPLDYSIANSTTIFPAEKIFALVQQLHAQGIKINIMAHSLGNAVLMRVLDQCGANGIQIDHAFMWDAAIPNSAFDDNAKKKFMPLMLSNPATGQAQPIPYEFNFPNAAKGVKLVSILYSQQDTVLGAIPSGDDTWNVLHQTTDDPGAGLALAATAGGTQVLSDALAVGGVKRPLNSVYYVSNLFTYPLSFFTNGTQDLLNNYYQSFCKTYAQTPGTTPHWQDKNGTITSFAKDLATQRAMIASKYPGLFNLIANGAFIGDKDSAATKASYNNLSDKEKATAAALDALHLFTPLSGKAFATGDSLTPQGEHAKDVATIILSGLLCMEAQPDQALGYMGILPSNPLFNDPMFQQSDQTKPGTQPTDKDHYLCVDHNAMLFPTPDFMTYIYKGILFNAQTNIKFQFFGKWKPA